MKTIKDLITVLQILERYSDDSVNPLLFDGDDLVITTVSPDEVFPSDFEVLKAFGFTEVNGSFRTSEFTFKQF